MIKKMADNKHVQNPQDSQNVVGIGDMSTLIAETIEKPQSEERMDESLKLAATSMHDNPVRDATQSEESGDECSGDLVLSHHEVMVKVQSTLSDIIATDPLLYDLPPQVTLEEINSYIALEHGKAMVINVRRADDEVLPIVVTQNASVLDLKHAIKRFVNLKQERANDKTSISWRYVWKRYWLYYDGVKLTDDKKLLKDYGLVNKDEVTFIKRLKEKGKFIEQAE